MMGKEEIDIFSVPMRKFGEKKNTDMFTGQFSVLNMNVVQIPDFNWLPGRHKAYIL